MTRTTLICMFVVLMIGGATPARATVVSDPVRIRWNGPRVEPDPGRPFSGSLEISVSRPLRLEDIRLVTAAGRRPAGTGVPPAAWVEPGTPLSVSLELERNEREAPLELTYVLEGRAFVKPIDLTPVAVARTTSAAVSESRERSEYGTGAVRPLRPRSAERRALGRLRRERPATREAVEKGEASASARDITVTGRIVYTRGDGQQRNAEGVRVEVFDEDEIYDQYLAGGTTAPDGTFSLTFHWDPWPWEDDRPDLLIYYETINAHVQVQTSGIFEDNYNWESGVEDDFEGTEYDFQDLSPTDSDYDTALDLCTQVSREWRWFDTVPGYDVPTVDVQWPEDGTGAFYKRDWDEIHVCRDVAWDEETVYHEYGHHWINHYAAVDYDIPPYCNGFCDGGSCGHCIWCKETPEIAWGEGFPYWIASVVGRWNMATNDPTPFKFRGFDSLSSCPQDLAFHAPDSTEGFFIALVRDLDDTNQDDNNPTNPWMDRVDLDPVDILSIVDDDEPLTPLHFLARVKARFPAITEDLWETAKDIGYEPDVTPPGAPTGLASTSHPFNLIYTDATCDLAWTRATDDWSGVAGYSITFSTGAPLMPDATQDIGDVTSYTSAPLAPGNGYYFNIRAVDRAGRWSATYAACGPFSIAAPDPVDLEFRLLLGWDWFIMPRPTPDATVGNVQAPDSLNGNCNCTYWNYAAQNAGGQATGTTTYHRLRVDGTSMATASVSSISAGGTWSHTNRGPVNIRGGRHTFEVDLDATGVLAEQHEDDNTWAEQWIWSPLQLTDGTRLTRLFPPHPTAGWEAMDPDDPHFYNCDGFRFTTSGWWNAVAIRGLNDRNDWDCRLHAASTGPADGFAANVGWSSRPAGCLDAVLVNRNLTGNGAWDVGVLDFNFTAVNAQYTIEQVTSSSHTFGTEAVVPLGQDESIALREFQVSSGNLGWVEIVVQTDTPDVPIHARWFDAAFDRGDLDDEDAAMTTDEQGFARMDVNIQGTGYHCVVLFRDPRDGLAPVQVTLRIGASPPELVPFAAGGWYAPLVPRRLPDGMAGFVPMPDSLLGNIPSTYLNSAAGNSGHASAVNVLNRFFVDGALLASTQYSSLAAGGFYLQNSTVGRTIRGGRHTLAMELDPLAVIHEVDDSNNAWGEQFVWGPLALLINAPVTRGAPPDASGGFLDVTTGEPLHPNCDGLRTPLYVPVGENGWWGGAAVMPHIGTDVDARLHEPKTGAKLGFETASIGSYWGKEQSDYVLANMRVNPLRRFDVGVTLSGPGVAAYTAEAVASVYRGALPAGDFGPFTMLPDRILDLHEFWLSAGSWTFRVVNTTGVIDWGVALHSGDQPWLNKSSCVDGGTAWFAPAGQDEEITAIVPADGYYCLAVWKTRSEVLGETGSYLVQAGPAAVGVSGGDNPTRTMLRPAYPTPSHDATYIGFELPQAEEVDLAVFDIRGARVRTVARGPWPAGRHRAAWDGRMDGGQRAPGGVYLIRLSAGRTTMATKVVRLE